MINSNNYWNWSHSNKFKFNTKNDTIREWALSITEDMLIEDYDKVKYELNTKSWIEYFDSSIIQLTNNTSAMYAPKEKDPIEVISRYCDWAREENWSDRLRLFMRLKDK